MKPLGIALIHVVIPHSIIHPEYSVYQMHHQTAIRIVESTIRKMVADSM